MKRFLQTLLFLPLFVFAQDQGGGAEALSPKQRAFIPIAAFTAAGEMEKLEDALVAGLETGLSINEIKESIVHLYAYTGFPRSLNALNLFMEVVESRKQAGIEDTVGKEASPLPEDFDKNAYGAKVRAKLAGREKDISGAPWQEFSPAIDTFLKEHLFADIFARDVISHKTRELVTISALAALPGTQGQLRFHYKASMNVGLTQKQLQDFITTLRKRVDTKRATVAGDVLDEVLKAP